MGRRPLRQRPWDLVFIAFFIVNAAFITYLFDIEQLTVSKPLQMSGYPAWPPHQMVDLVHWYGNHYDPLLMARPAFFRMTIWIDVVAFGPFYLAAIYAFVRGREWIRVPALVWSGVMMANVAIILFEERVGVYATSHFAFVTSVNLPWLLLPLTVIARLRRDHPFAARPAEPTPEPAPASGPVPEARPAVDAAGVTP
jgi:hypothetical protein